MKFADKYSFINESFQTFHRTSAQNLFNIKQTSVALHCAFAFLFKMYFIHQHNFLSFSDYKACTCVCFDGKKSLPICRWNQSFFILAHVHVKPRVKSNILFVFRAVICFLSSLEATFTAVVLWNKHFQLLNPNFRPHRTHLDLKAVPCKSRHIQLH